MNARRIKDGSLAPGTLKRLVCVLLAPLVLPLASSCAPDFEQVQDVVDLRVLGVKMSPPELLLPGNPLDMMEAGNDRNRNEGNVGQDEPDGEGPGIEFPDPSDFPGIPVTLTFLVANPKQAGAELDYKLVGCIVDEKNYDCKEEPRPLLAQGKASAGETAVNIVIPTDLILASAEADPYFGYFGFAIWVMGEVESESEKASFLKAFVLSWDYDGQRGEPNTNPEISEMMQGEKGEETAIELDADSRMQVAVGESVRFLPVVPQEDRQTFSILTTKGEFKELTEEISVHFYSSCGSFSLSEKSERIDIGLETDEDKEKKTLGNNWTAPALPQTCNLWFVADDGRGGVGWMALEVVSRND